MNVSMLTVLTINIINGDILIIVIVSYCVYNV